MMGVIRTANLGVRLLLEIAALIALGYWGFHTGPTRLAKIALGLGAPLLAGLLWSRYGAPGAATPLSGPPRLLFEAVIFGLAALALAATGRRTLAIALATTFVINRALMLLWKQ